MNWSPTWLRWNNSFMGFYRQFRKQQEHAPWLYFSQKRGKRISDTTEIGGRNCRNSGKWQREQKLGTNSRSLEQEEVSIKIKEIAPAGVDIQAKDPGDTGTEKPVSHRAGKPLLRGLAEGTRVTIFSRSDPGDSGSAGVVKGVHV